MAGGRGPGESPLILVIDEIMSVVRLIEAELGFEGMRSEPVLLDEDPVGRAIESRPDAIVIGSMVPAPLVYEALTRLKKETSVPILMVGSTGREADAAVAIEMGADDVLERPFSPEDLVLRLRALLHMEPAEERMIQRGRLEIDVQRRIVRMGDARLALGTTEWVLLLALARQEGRVPPRELLVQAWGEEYAEENRFLEIWVNRLREHLMDDPKDPQVILGDAESGYYLAAAIE